MADQPDDRRPAGPYTGAGIAIGAGVGAAIFAATDNPAWIGIGAALGVVFGAGLDRRRRDD